jgi:hypothetical protein
MARRKEPTAKVQRKRREQRLRAKGTETWQPKRAAKKEKA